MLRNERNLVMKTSEEIIEALREVKHSIILK